MRRRRIGLLLPLAMLGALASIAADCGERERPPRPTVPDTPILVSVTPAVVELRVGQTRTLTAQLTGGGGVNRDGVSWSAEPPGLVGLSVDGTGLTVTVLALAPGTATVAADTARTRTPGTARVVVFP